MMESMMMMAAAIFLLLVLADFSLADTPQDRISGRMYVRFLSGWQTVCAAFSKKGTLEKFDNPAICLSDPQIASGASEPLAAVAKATAKYSSYQSRQRHRNTESLQRRQYNRKMMDLLIISFQLSICASSLAMICLPLLRCLSTHSGAVPE